MATMPFCPSAEVVPSLTPTKSTAMRCRAGRLFRAVLPQVYRPERPRTSHPSTFDALDCRPQEQQLVARGGVGQIAGVGAELAVVDRRDGSDAQEQAHASEQAVA
jgi:hypothetical protein